MRSVIEQCFVRTLGTAMMRAREKGQAILILWEDGRSAGGEGGGEGGRWKGEGWRESMYDGKQAAADVH